MASDGGRPTESAVGDKNVAVHIWLFVYMTNRTALRSLLDG